MSPQTLLASIRDEIVEATASFWTDAEVYRYMWHAEYILADATNCTEATTAITTITNQSDYTTPANVLHYLRVEYNNSTLKRIGKSDRDSLEFRPSGGTFSAGTPYCYLQFGDLTTLYPTPNAAKTVNIDFVKRPAEITTASTQFTIPEQFQFYIKDYAIYRCLSKDDKNQEAQIYLGLWNDNLKQARKEWTDRNGTGRFRTVKSEEFYPTTDLGPF